MVERSNARVGSIILGGFYSAVGAIKLFRVDPLIELHDNQVRNQRPYRCSLVVSLYY